MSRRGRSGGDISAEERRESRSRLVREENSLENCLVNVYIRKLSIVISVYVKINSKSDGTGSELRIIYYVALKWFHLSFTDFMIKLPPLQFQSTIHGYRYE